MKTVLILGAGASRQAGGPLMSDFIDKAEELYRTKRVGEAEESFKDVLNAVSELQGIHAKAYLNLDNFETLFGAIEMAMITGKLAGRKRESIAELRNSIVTLIVKTLENTIRFPVTENHIYPPRPYNQLADQIVKLRQEAGENHRELTFITFNYDVALDYALSHNGSLGGPDYCLSEPPAFTRIPLLKLHGSINWGVCAECQKIVPWDFDRVRVSPPYYGNDHIFDLGSNIDREQHCGRPLNRCPVIIPPTWNKTGYHQDLARVWSRASSELSTAENIFVIGYSLPETDSFFRYLYALGSEGATRIKRFWVFDPDTDGTVEPRFRTMIGRGIENRFKFIKQTFDKALPVIFDELRKL